MGNWYLGGGLTVDDKELLDQFMKERQKKKKLFEYVVKYNGRNAAKVK